MGECGRISAWKSSREFDLMKHFETLLLIARRKAVIDADSKWSEGARTYLGEMNNEITEVCAELSSGRQCYLEDELGDVLWDYLNALAALEKSHGISVEKVLQRACRKYEERISGIENGRLWKEIKLHQKQAIAEEQRALDKKTDDQQSSDKA